MRLWNCWPNKPSFAPIDIALPFWPFGQKGFLCCFWGQIAAFWCFFVNFCITFSTNAIMWPNYVLTGRLFLLLVAVCLMLTSSSCSFVYERIFWLHLWGLSFPLSGL